MLKTYQITLFCADGRYKPVSALVQLDKELFISKDLFNKQLKRKGIEKICVQRYWNITDLKKYGYSKIKMRDVTTVKHD